VYTIKPLLGSEVYCSLHKHSKSHESLIYSNIFKCKISCSHEIDFSIENSIATLLGFRNVVYTTDSTHESENIVNIMKINDICEYPVLPKNTSHSWTIQSSSLLEKPFFF